MKTYIRERKKSESTSTVVGIVLTVAAHVFAAIVVSFTGFKYIYPPPEETSFLIDFEEEKAPVIRQRYGRQPRAEEVDKTKPINLIQKSQSPIESKAKQNLTAQGAPDNFGDVETPVPEQQPEVNKNALFPGMSKKDTSLTAPHSAETATPKFKAGQADGNTVKGVTDGRPNARLKGRSSTGNLPRPTYNVQEEGTVVVTIWVDNYGTVKKAVAGADGTTVTDKALWAAARKAAMDTHFNTTMDAPPMQEGTITYVFKLK